MTAPRTMGWRWPTASMRGDRFPVRPWREQPPRLSLRLPGWRVLGRRWRWLGLSPRPQHRGDACLPGSPAADDGAASGERNELLTHLRGTSTGLAGAQDESLSDLGGPAKGAGALAEPHVLAGLERKPSPTPNRCVALRFRGPDKISDSHTPMCLLGNRHPGVVQVSHVPLEPPLLLGAVSHVIPTAWPWRFFWLGASESLALEGRR
eukprot:scaffold284938_cov27-Tisochrysis_lutea.AAC.4